MKSSLSECTLAENIGRYLLILFTIDKTEFVVALVGKQTQKVIRRVDDEYQGRDCERLL